MTAPTLATILCVPVLALSICGMGKKTEKDVCKHMNEVLKDEGKTPISDAEMSKCVSSVQTDVGKCKNRQEVIDCYMKLTSSTDKSCKAVCDGYVSTPRDTSSPKPTSGGASSAKIECINECTRKHGALIDLSKTRACAQKHQGDMPGLQACMDAAKNPATDSCMKGCNNL